MTACRTPVTLAGMDIDLETLSLRELNVLLADAEKRLQIVKSRRPATAVKRLLTAAAAQAGYTIEEVLGTSGAAPAAQAKKPARRRLGKVAPKYRDPENKRNTWSGRGRMPLWLVEKTRHGRSPADYLIPGLARPTLSKGSVIGKRTVFKQA